MFDFKNSKDQNVNKTEGAAKEKLTPAVGLTAEAPKVEEAKPVLSCVYGPIGSWRFGRALGIDMLCTDDRTCNFNCVYCRFPDPGKVQTERQEFVSTSKLFDDINAVKGVSADWAVFAGMGEPTLATNLGEAITMVKSVLGLPVAVMTNGSFIKVKDVRKALSLADMVVIKLDAFDDASFNVINRPTGVFSLGKMVGQWQLFRVEYKGKIAVSVMLNDMNKGGMYDLQINARMVVPDQIQLSTPQHCDAMKPLSKADYDKGKQWFWNCKEVVNRFEAKVPVVEPLNAAETEKRHPSAIKKEVKTAKP